MATERIGDRSKFLLDPWSRDGRVRLDHIVERVGVPPILMALAVLVIGFITFQLIGSIVSSVMLAREGVAIADVLEDFERVIAEHGRVVIFSNTVGQILGLGGLGLVLAWMHSSQIGSFLRLRRSDGSLLLLSLVGLMTLLPTVWWLGHLNEGLPLPEFLQQLEAQRMQVIEGVVRSDAGLLFTLAALAVTPAICEELFFRGYLQRQFERGAGAAVGILLTGILFGMYHLSPLQILPLATLGTYLAYITWRTGSLWAAVLVHFTNNAYAVVAAQQMASQSDARFTDLETLQMPWYIVVLGIILFAVIMYVLDQRARHLLTERP